MTGVKIFYEVLDQQRLRILPELDFLRREYSAYLAGGTALALQIGHRTSLDFDFYSPGVFDNQAVLRCFENRFKNLLLIQNPKNTLVVRVQGIEISLFHYDYPLLTRPIRTEFIDLASIKDIAAMKLIAIIQRGRMRDFIDMYFILKQLTLGTVFGLTKKKFPPFNPYIGLRALTYFQDAEEDPQPDRFILRQKADWPEVKRVIIAKVSEFTRRGLER